MEHGSGPVSREEFNRLDRDVNGNGQPGLKQNVETALGDLAEIKGAQRERARIDANRWNWQTFILGVFGLILALLTYLEANRQFHTGELTWPQIFHSQSAQPRYNALNVEDADQW
jgi:hypothetical protein